MSVMLNRPDQSWMQLGFNRIWTDLEELANWSVMIHSVWMCDDV